MSFMRGAISTPRHKLAGATPFKAVAAPTQFLWPITQLSMWGNADYGDCVTAEEAFAKSCRTPGGGVLITDDIVTSWAKANGFLNGANLQNVLDKMQTGGFEQGGSKWDDGPYQSIDWTNAAILQSAITLGPVKIGVAASQLEITCKSVGEGVSGWFAIGYKQDYDEDHCVSLCGYGPISWLAEQLGEAIPDDVDGTQPAYAIFTWESVGIIDVPSLLAICGEAWVRNPTTQMMPATLPLTDIG